MNAPHYQDRSGQYHRLDTRHGFLAALHDVVQPRTYLEIGVQHGYSLDLAHAAQVAIGVDPEPLIQPRGNQEIYRMTSDEFFKTVWNVPGWLHDTRPVDLAFIDGMHLAEYALRDFANIHRYIHARSVVVFDDVLPRNAHEARRLEPGTPIVGDWTGDVWKVIGILTLSGFDFTCRLVDVDPTGLLVVSGFGPNELPGGWVDSLDQDWLLSNDPPPDAVIKRVSALRPLVALQQIRRELYPGEDAP